MLNMHIYSDFKLHYKCIHVCLSLRLSGHGCSGGSVHLHRGASSAQLCCFLHGRAQWSDQCGLWQRWHRLQGRGLHHGRLTACPTNNHFPNVNFPTLKNIWVLEVELKYQKWLKWFLYLIVTTCYRETAPQVCYIIVYVFLSLVINCDFVVQRVFMPPNWSQSTCLTKLRNTSWLDKKLL